MKIRALAGLRNRKAVVLSAGALMLALVICAGCGQGKKANASSNDKPDSAAAGDSAKTATQSENQAVPVEITPIRRGNIDDYILQNATIETEDGVEVYSRLVGVVVKLYVEEGAHVSRGSRLCQLEDEDYILARDKARVVYQKQQTDFARYKDMFDKQLTSKERFDEIRYLLDQAKIDLDKAELDLERTRITAPISGVITLRQVKLGERVTNAAPLFKVVDMAEKITVVRIPERELRRVSGGQLVYLTSENLPDLRFEARVKRVSPVVDPASGTFKVTVGVRDEQEMLRPGMFVAVHLITATHENALLIPKSAVVYENGLPYAFFVEQDTLARRLRLESGFSNEQSVEVLSGIGDTNRVIVVGQNSLKDGARIKIVESLFKGQETKADTSLTSK